MLAQVKIAVINPEAIYRLGLISILTADGNLRVASEFESFADFEQSVTDGVFDVVLMEGSVISGHTEALESMIERLGLKVVVQLADSDDRTTVDLYRSGVRGVVRRSIIPAQLTMCISKVADGQIWIDNSAISAVLSAYRQQSKPAENSRADIRLSPKEIRVIQGVTRGLRNKDIAVEIGTSEQVIKNYLRKIYDKLKVEDRVSLMRYCMQHNVGQNQTQPGDMNTEMRRTA